MKQVLRRTDWLVRKLGILILGGYLMGNLGGVLAGTEEGCLISHQSEETFEEIFEKTKKRLQESDELTVPREQALWMLDQVSQFDLGRFILQNKGINGYWTAYAILHGLEKDLSNPLENWVIRRSPIFLATQERFKIFQKQIEMRISSGMALASIPCGVMDDLLLADRRGTSDIKFYGIDLDEESLALARENAYLRGVEKDCQFLKRNAWNLGIDAEYDLIASNGLNVYEPDAARVKELYRNFYQALRPEGILITSFWTYPPALDENSPWKNYNLDDLKKQRALFVDVLQVKWQFFRTESEMRQHLESTGFEVLEVIYDHQAMFPTIVAKRIN